MVFDQSGPRWLGISDLIAEPEGPTFISYKLARSRLDRLRFVTQDPERTLGLVGHRPIFLLNRHSISRAEVRFERRARGTATGGYSCGGCRRQHFIFAVIEQLKVPLMHLTSPITSWYKIEQDGAAVLMSLVYSQLRT